MSRFVQRDGGPRGSLAVKGGGGGDMRRVQGEPWGGRGFNIGCGGHGGVFGLKEDDVPFQVLDLALQVADVLLLCM